MADTSYISQSGALLDAQTWQTLLENATMHLFQSSYTPQPTDPITLFQAAECTFDGYAPSTIATWDNPVLAGTAWALLCAIQIFRWTFSTGVNNMVGGYWIQTAGGTLVTYAVFDPAESAGGTGQAIVRTPVQVFPWG